MAGNTLKDASGQEVGHALMGFGVNLLVRHTQAATDFLVDVMGFELIRIDRDFALMRHGNQLFQFHATPPMATTPCPRFCPRAVRAGAALN